MNAHSHAHYLSHVQHYRIARDSHIERILQQVGDPHALVAFLLEYCALRLGAFRRVPGWLRGSARNAAQLGELELARELELAAKREDEHRHHLLADLLGQHEVWQRELGHPALSLSSLVRRASERKRDRVLDAHLERRQDSARSPFVMIAAELELAEFGLRLGPALVELAHRELGTAAVECVRFVDARAREASDRAEQRRARLDALIERQGEFASRWAGRAGKLVDGYGELLVQRAVGSELLTADQRRCA